MGQILTPCVVGTPQRMPSSLSQLNSPEIQYILLVVGLFIVPRALQRFRLPSAVTCVLIGAVFGMGLGAFHGDTTVPLLGVLGIVSLFLFAGLEVDFAELRRGALIIAVHLLIQTLLLAGAAGLIWRYLYFDVRKSILYALAVVTPSTGFILDSLHSFGLSQDQRYWVKSKAIAAELLALAILFFTTQTQSHLRFTLSTVALVAMTLLLPVIFRTFARRILPFAPNSEFAFLVIIALVCAAITRMLGVYYLVGAFLVGVTARRFGEELPAVASKDLLRSIELFASFFIPFYFFKAGLRLTTEDFGWRSLVLGGVLVIVVAPLRVLTVAIQRARMFERRIRTAARVGISLLPTLVFTLVIANILREQYELSPTYYGALIVYALLTTLIPGLVLGATQVYDAPQSLFPPKISDGPEPSPPTAP